MHRVEDCVAIDRPAEKLLPQCCGFPLPRVGIPRAHFLARAVHELDVLAPAFARGILLKIKAARIGQPSFLIEVLAC